MSSEMFRLRHSARMLAGSETAEIMLYGEIISDMPEDWKWSKEDKSAADFDKAVKKVREDGARNALLRINSPGGYVWEAVAMRSILVNAGFEKIDIRIEGICASAATLLATIPGAHVTITPGSEFMIHNPHARCLGTAADFEHAAQWLRSEEESFRALYAQKCGRKDEEIKAWMDKETWFSAQDAVDAGFCDAVLEEDGKTVMAAACVSGRAMSAMRVMYAHVPERIAVQEDDKNEDTSNGTPAVAADVPSENNNLEEDEHDMEIHELTNEQLLAGNPELHAAVMNAGAQAERQRIADIDDLTPPGYEQMASEAKSSGMSALDYHKSIVKAQREKGSQFMANRQKETAPAAKVEGGAAEMSSGSEDDDNKAAKEIAEFAKAMRYGESGMF